LILVLGVLLAYAQFPFWPSEPPRTVFPGEDVPSMQTIFRRFNWFLLGGYGIHTSVFPSAHVSGACSAAFGAMRALPEKPWVWRTLLVTAMLIATATVYGRYHYVVDAVAGVAVSGLALALGRLAGRSSRA
jgi:membrane-associated phospholipid phosphatase